MRLTILIPLFAFTFVLHLAATAAVPLKWTVETSRATPAQFEAYQGETLALEATLQSYGKPLEASGIAALYWQTNGMGSAYWEATAAVNSNRLSAVWTPEMDVGAKSYNCFIGVPGTVYHAAFQLRLRPSPGALPNTLPLPVPVIDFAKVRVLNPPWEGGGGGGVNTNAVIDIIHKTVDGAARPLPKYLHLYNADDSYPDAAAEYYRSRGDGKVDGGCSSVRDGGFLYRNFDYPFDDRAEFVVRMSAVPGRFASIGVASVGTNLTESFVTSGKPSRWYKSLPGATVDGINEHGVVAEINVVDGDPQTSGWHTTGDLHPLAAVRWVLDNATNAQHAAEHLAANIRFPEGWQQNFHYMIADETATYVVENGEAYTVPSASSPTGALPALTNFRLYGDPKDTTGEGQERYIALTNGANITSQWWTLTYTPDGYRASDLPGITGSALTQLFDYWASKPREQHRGETFHSSTSTSDFDSISWWQTVHTSIYDITNRVLRVAVQEKDDWYVFAVGANGVTEVSWDNVTGKPVMFPPSHHTHLIDDVSNLDHTLNDIQATATRAESLAAEVKYNDLPTKLDKNDADYKSVKAKAENALPMNGGGTITNEYGVLSTIIAPDYVGVENIIGGGNHSILSNGRVSFGTGSGDNANIDKDGISFDEGDESKHYVVSWPDSSGKFALTNDISATNPAFSNAVLAVQIDTNLVANIGELREFFDGLPVGTVGTSLGGVILALLAAAAYLKKKTALLDNEGKATDDFATELMEKQVAKAAIRNLGLKFDETEGYWCLETEEA